MFDISSQNSAARILPLPDENDLLARIAEGDEKAFAPVFHHYRRKIYSYAYHLCGNSAQADELVQDVFMKVWMHREKLPHILRFDNWLFTIARNQVFDMLKNMAKESALRREMAGLPEPGANLVEDIVLTRENEEQLQRALDQLSPRQKLIFTLSRHQGMKHEEIASHLHISRHTVKTHLVQALRTLRDILHFPSDGILLVCLLLIRDLID